MRWIAVLGCTGCTTTLSVTNGTPDEVTVRVGGEDVGVVAAGGSGRFSVSRGSHTLTVARSAPGEAVVASEETPVSAVFSPVAVQVACPPQSNVVACPELVQSALTLAPPGGGAPVQIVLGSGDAAPLGIGTYGVVSFAGTANVGDGPQQVQWEEGTDSLEILPCRNRYLRVSAAGPSLIVSRQESCPVEAVVELRPQLTLQ